jgi:hypothetical protein
MGFVISVGAADTEFQETAFVSVLSLPFLIVAADTRGVNEFAERCCHIPNNKVGG